MRVGVYLFLLEVIKGVPFGDHIWKKAVGSDTMV